MLPAGSIQNQDIDVATHTSRSSSLVANIKHRVVSRSLTINRHVQLAADGLHPFDTGRVLQVGCHQHQTVSAVLQFERQFPTGGCCATFRVATQQQDGELAVRTEVERLSVYPLYAGLPHHFEQLLINHSEELLPGIHRLAHLAANRRINYAVGEYLGNLVGDVFLEQCQLYCFKAFRDIPLRDSGLPP